MKNIFMIECDFIIFCVINMYQSENVMKFHIFDSDKFINAYIRVFGDQRDFYDVCEVII